MHDTENEHLDDLGQSSRMSACMRNGALVVLSEAAVAVRQATTHGKASRPPGEQRRRLGQHPVPVGTGDAERPASKHLTLRSALAHRGPEAHSAQQRAGKRRERQPREHTALLDARSHSHTNLTAKTLTLSGKASHTVEPDRWQVHGSALHTVFYSDNSPHHSAGLHNLRRLRHSTLESWGAGAEQLCSRRDPNPQGGRIRVAVGAEVVFSALPVVRKGRAAVSGGTAV